MRRLFPALKAATLLVSVILFGALSIVWWRSDTEQDVSCRKWAARNPDRLGRFPFGEEYLIVWRGRVTYCRADRWTDDPRLDPGGFTYRPTQGVSRPFELESRETPGWVRRPA